MTLTATAPTKRSVHADKAPESAPPPQPKRVVVGTDGSRAAGSAIRFARLMADHGVWAPRAVTVLEPLPVAVSDMMLGPPSLLYQQQVTDGLLGSIGTQLKRAGGKDWPFTVQFGRAAPVVARFAREASADMIVLGLGKHGKLARFIGAETVARVVRLSEVPVLAVNEGERSLPYTAVVAMDFGESSIRAAREAFMLLQPPGRLHLLHVRTVVGNKPGDPEWEKAYAAGVQRGFQRVMNELGRREGIRVTTDFRRGLVLETVLSAAKRLVADILAAGSHSQTVVDRLLIGSTAAQLLRASPCSVLIAPPMSVA